MMYFTIFSLSTRVWMDIWLSSYLGAMENAPINRNTDAPDTLALQLPVCGSIT